MISVLLLLALPASGKSEIRRYLGSLTTTRLRDDFGFGPLVQLDDFPYVHVMRRVSEEAVEAGAEPPFFPDVGGTFLDPHDWLTLIELINQDYAALRDPVAAEQSPGRWLLSRLAATRKKAGARPLYLDDAVYGRVASALNDEGSLLSADLSSRRLESGGSVLIEFARGGPVGSAPPLPYPRGYQSSLAMLSPAILERAAVLYVQVTPEESRRKNLERFVPGQDGSILHHGVPEAVMTADYGMDDFLWLMSQARREGFLDVVRKDQTYELPAAVFDNREDLTSFLREDPSGWPAGAAMKLHERLQAAFGRLSFRGSGDRPRPDRWSNA